MASEALRGLAYLVQRFLLRRERLVTRIEPWGLELEVGARDVVGRHLYKYGRYEPEVAAFLERDLELAPGDVVLDVGGNIGWYSVLLDRIAPDGVDVYAFEPDPSNLELLRANVERNAARKVHPRPLAVAERAGRQTLYLYSDRNRGRHSLLPLHEGETLEVETVTLDGFWAEEGLAGRRPGFIKIDIEGYELPALRGAGDVLARCPTLLLEYSPRFMEKAGLEPASLLELLAGTGLEPHVIAPERLEPVSRDTLLGSDRHLNLVWRRA